MNWGRSKKTVVVHDGSFHPDDVFSVALISIICQGKIKVIRTRDEKSFEKADYVVDVGLEYNPARNRFDHHQEGGAGERDNKITYSSFGLLWKYYGEQVSGSRKVADIIDRKLVTAVDADDCGIDLGREVVSGLRPPMLVDVIYSMLPTWKETDLQRNKIFLQAVDFAENVLKREIKIAQDNIEAESLVGEVYKESKDKRLIILDEVYLPISLFSKYPEPAFMVCRDKAGRGWKVTTITKMENSFEARKNFPEVWWGKTDEALAKVSGVSDAVFCRNGGIYAGAKSKAGAIKLAELALNNK